jgi:hypothetical protein
MVMRLVVLDVHVCGVRLIVSDRAANTHSCLSIQNVFSLDCLYKENTFHIDVYTCFGTEVSS